jgi:hypothetical protein
MLYKYKCTVQPTLCSKTFPYFEQAFDRFRILDKWFYFYINEPIKPVIVWKTSNLNNYQLQPGTNRYIGVSLRNNNELIDGLFVTDNEKEIYRTPDEIKVFDLVDSVDLDMDYPDFYYIHAKTESHIWGINGTYNFTSGWYQPVWDWIGANLKHSWGLEYNGKIYYVNRHTRVQRYSLIENLRSIRSCFRKPYTIVQASDFPNVQQAVHHLFELIKTTEKL